MEVPPRGRAQIAIDWLIYAALLGVAGIVRLAGPRAGYAVAALAGEVWYRLFRRRRQVVRRNLEIAFGGALAPAEARRIGRLSCRHALANLIEVLVRDREIARRGWQTVFEPDPALRREMAAPSPSGLAVLGAHLGSWEMGHYVLGCMGAPVTPVVRRLDNPFLNRAMEALRRRFGQGLIYKSGALRALARTLRAGGRVALLVDQSCPTEEAFAPFFGAPTSVYADYAKVLVRRGCRVVFSVCLRRGYGFRFTSWTRPLAVPAEGTLESRAQALVRAYLEAVEDAARLRPEQYLWMHRRWKRRPPGLPSLYDDLGKPLEQARLCGNSEDLRRTRRLAGAEAAAGGQSPQPP